MVRNHFMPEKSCFQPLRPAGEDTDPNDEGTCTGVGKVFLPFFLTGCQRGLPSVLTLT
jgi:hypothetical protein